ncbi:IS110 family transposase [Cupriavidus oxalaticus]|uniref:IS110 family transposase n=1 Tax=Cupriavidus oxalaticus TaxID=96344 RepID=UPI001E5FE509|nr:IS110 family transposase [Cupriavidus oxalaticus]
MAEIGGDMTRFSDAGHLVSWAGLCPRNRDRGGPRGPAPPTPPCVRVPADP